MEYSKALLALEDGRVFPCRSFTGPGETSGEIVFNTGMSGYQEVLTDPSYRGQMVTMTYPLIGNYGVNPEDVESDRIQVSAFLVKEYQNFPSNYRSTKTLAEYLKEENILGVDNLDTRALTRHIRNAGAMRAVISTLDLDPESLVQKANAIPSMVGQDLEAVLYELFVLGESCPFQDLVTTVSLIIEKWMVDMLEMNPYLMGSAGLKTAFKQAEVAQAFNQPVVGHRRFPMGTV